MPSLPPKPPKYYNRSQNIWHKLKKYSKLDFKNVISNFACKIEIKVFR